MLYCERCCIMFENEFRCPHCGGRHIREAQADDLCLAAETNYIMSGVLADVFRQEQIPFVTRNALGAALAAQVGVGMDRTRFLVRQDMLAKAQEIADDLLAPVCADPEETDNDDLSEDQDDAFDEE